MTVSLEDYSVQILGGKHLPDNYVALPHEKKYSIYLRSRSSKRCHVDIWIDGKHQGTWVMPDNYSEALERPANDDGHFTFYKLGTSAGSMAGLSANKELGLVKVVFTPEKPALKMPSIDSVDYTSYKGEDYSYRERGVSKSPQLNSGPTRGGSYSAGGTGLSGKSSQEFGRTNALDLDHVNAVTIYLRLICDETNVDQPRPLTRSTPVPPSLL